MADPGRTGPSVSAADRATIVRLAEQLVPALSATLSAAGLSEVEVRRPGWRVRVRRAAAPAGSSADAPSGRRRGTDRGERGPDRSERADRAVLTDPVAHHDRSNGSGPTTAHPARSPRREAESPEDRFRVIATSPSVGPFRPDRELRRGARVREGDRLGTVDLLGVPQEVVAPADGIVMAILVEADEAVEYGQPLVELERASGTSGTSTASGAGSTPAGAGEG